MDTKFTTNYETNLFIEKYLKNFNPLRTYRNPQIINRNWNEIVKDLRAPNVNEDDIQLYVRNNFSGKKNYHSYSDTLYWHIVADVVKLIGNYECQLDIKHDNTYLVAHHNTYEFFGKEVQNFHKLICICRPCHNKFHNNEGFVNPSLYDAFTLLNNKCVETEEMKEFMVRNQIYETITIDEPSPKSPIIFNDAFASQKQMNYDLYILNQMLDRKKISIKQKQ